MFIRLATEFKTCLRRPSSPTNFRPFVPCSIPFCKFILRQSFALGMWQQQSCENRQNTQAICTSLVRQLGVTACCDSLVRQLSVTACSATVLCYSLVC